jgi:hypothetical protein
MEATCTSETSVNLQQTKCHIHEDKTFITTAVRRGCRDQHFLDLGNSWRWVVSFTPRPGPGTHWIAGWMDPRAGLDDVEKRKFLPLQELQLRPLGRPARRLYRLRCPSCFSLNSGLRNCSFLSGHRVELQSFTQRRGQECVELYTQLPLHGLALNQTQGKLLT